MADHKHTFAFSDKSVSSDKNRGAGSDSSSSGGQVSEGPSSMSDVETSLGGADSVPDTPDAMPPVERGAGPEVTE